VTPSSIVVSVRASAINPVDYKKWKYNFLKQPLPLTLGQDYSGVIVSVGPEATGGWKVGDEVFGAARIDGPGSHAQFVVTDGQRLARKPAALSHEQAASLPIAFLSAYDGITLAKVTPGSTVLIGGAGGGVGHYAVQLAKLHGATVFAFGSRAESLDLLKKIGADHVIDYKKEDAAKRVIELTKGHGVDIVFDPTAGASYALTAAALKHGGRFVGLDVHPPAESAPVWGVLKSRHYAEAHFADTVKYSIAPENQGLLHRTFAAPLSWAAELVSSGRMLTHISATLPFDDALVAEIVAMEAGKTQTGKVVVNH
jgi:NADPH2:quinone reductase